MNAANGDYNLLCNSPCIDVGDPSPIFNDPDGSQNDMGVLPAVSVYITISGNVSSDCGGGLLGVTVDLDLPGGDMITTSTDSMGNYIFSDIPPSGDTGVISIVTPLGYAAVTPGDGQDFILLQSSQVFNFTPACLEPTGDARGLAYWKHQANVYLKGKGKAEESQLDMETNFPAAIFSHFFENQLNSIQVESVAIHDLAGRLVREFEGSAPAGTVQIDWDGTDARGYPVSSGLYLYRGKAGPFSATRKMTLMK